jgi:PAS domain S-box-containing protein
MDRSERGAGGRPADIRDASHTATAAVDTQGNVEAWSPGAALLLGHRADEVVGRPADTLLDARVSAATRRALLEDGGGAVRTVMLRQRDGRTVGAEVLAQPWVDSLGMTRRLWVFARMTDGDLVDRELTEWSFDQTPYVGGIHGSDLSYVRVNQLARTMWNGTEDELIGKKPAELMPTAEGAEMEAAMRRAVASGEPVYIEQVSRMPGDARAHPWAGHYTPLKDPSGRVRAVHSLAIDISERYRAQERLALVNRAGNAIGSTLDVDRTAEEMTEVLVPDLADFVTVDLLVSVLTDVEPKPGLVFSSGTLRRSAVRSVLDGCPEAVLQPGETEVFPDFSPHARAISSRRPLLSTIVGDQEFVRWTELNNIQPEKYGMHSAMMVPLRARGTTLGVATFVRHRNPADFDDNDLLLAEEITSKAAVSVDNALRYTRQRGTALALQRSLLPQRLPRQSAVEVATRYLAADTGAGVGGDWFDVIPLSGARIALIVGDVVGHGVRASATMGRLRMAVRTLAELELQPDELLTHLDDLVDHPLMVDDEEEDLDADSVIGATCLCAVYDPISQRCTIARAGHPAPVLVPPGGEAEILDVPAGPPLGLGGLPFENLEIDLPESSLLTLYTDGLIESRGRDVDEELARLGSTLALPATSLHDTCERVLRTLLPEQPEDDVALLIARTQKLDSGHVATWDFPDDPVSVGKARDQALRQLTTWRLEEAAFTTEMIVSELVTNAVRYAEGSIRLRLIWENSLICEVSDGSDTAPHLRRARSTDEGGRGLFLVAQLSDHWGTRHTANGKTIWADQSVPLPDVTDGRGDHRHVA